MRRHSISHRIPAAAENQILTPSLSLTLISPTQEWREQGNSQQLAAEDYTFCGYISF